MFAADPFFGWPADPPPFPDDTEQLACYWYVPNTDTPPYGMAYAVVSNAVARAAVAELEALGYAQQPAEEGSLLGYALPIDSLEADWLASWVYVARDGVLVRGSTVEFANDVAAALTVETIVAATPTATSDALDTPSTFSELTTLQGVQVTATGAVVLVVGVAVFIGILAWPGKLLESAVAARYSRLTNPFTRLRAAVARRVPVVIPMPRPLVLGLALLVAATITSFLDPGFGVVAASPRIFVSQLLALAAESLAGLLLVAWVVRRVAGVGSRLDVKAGSLVLAALAVLLSRLTGLQPGLVLGVIIGLAFSVELGRARERLVAVIEVGYLLVAGVVSWLVYSALAAIGLSGLAGTFVVEFFAGLAVATLSALPIALLPLGHLPGAALFEASRIGWGVAYAVATVLVLLVLLPLPASWESIETPLVAWFVAYAVYAILAVLARFALSRWVAPDDTPVGEARRDVVAP